MLYNLTKWIKERTGLSLEDSMKVVEDNTKRVYIAREAGFTEASNADIHWISGDVSRVMIEVLWKDKREG